MFPGDDARFEIFCNAFSDVEFSQIERTIGSPALPGESTSDNGLKPSEGRKVKLYEYTQSAGGYNLRVDGGVIE